MSNPTPAIVAPPVSWQLSESQNVETLLGLSIMLALTWALSFLAQEWLQRRRDLRRAVEEEEETFLVMTERERSPCVRVEMSRASYHASRADDAPPLYTSTWK